MAKIKEVSSYNGTSWDTPVPIGANDANIDITSSTTNPTDTTATSAGLVDSNVTVAAGDTAASAWTKFNRFRKRVQNAFGNFAGVTLRTAYNTSNTSTSVYTTGVINNYMSNVIGYTGTTAPSAGTVAAQLSSLNSNLNGALTNVQGQICAYVENADTSTHAYGDGGYIIWKCSLYRVKQYISVGTQFTPDTNIELATVGNELYKTQNAFFSQDLTLTDGGTLMCRRKGSVINYEINRANLDAVVSRNTSGIQDNLKPFSRVLIPLYIADTMEYCGYASISDAGVVTMVNHHGSDPAHPTAVTGGLLYGTASSAAKVI